MVPATTGSGGGPRGLMFSLRFVRVAGHLHAVQLSRIPQAVLKEVETAIVHAVLALAKQSIANALSSNADLVVALQRHSLKPADIVMTKRDVELLVSL